MINIQFCPLIMAGKICISVSKQRIFAIKQIKLNNVADIKIINIIELRKLTLLYELL
jgi:hypothetical protein